MMRFFKKYKDLLDVTKIFFNEIKLPISIRELPTKSRNYVFVILLCLIAIDFGFLLHYCMSNDILYFNGYTHTVAHIPIIGAAGWLIFLGFYANPRLMIVLLSMICHFNLAWTDIIILLCCPHLLVTQIAVALYTVVSPISLYLILLYSASIWILKLLRVFEIFSLIIQQRSQKTESILHESPHLYTLKQSHQSHQSGDRDYLKYYNPPHSIL